MTDIYYVVEYTDGVETGRSKGCNDRRLAERLGKMKERANPDKMYRIELHQPKNAPKY